MRLLGLNVLVLVTVALTNHLAGAELATLDSDVYVLEQSVGSINETKFREIGTVNIRTLKQQQNTAQYQSFNNDPNEQQAPAGNYEIRVTSNAFDAETKQEIWEESRKPESIYRLRLCRRQPANTCYASSFTYLHNVIESDMQIHLVIHINANNRLNSIAIKTRPSQRSITSKHDGENVATESPTFDHLTMNVQLQSTKSATLPDTESYLEKIKKELEQKEKSAQGENQSFLSKYWIYIVPFVVIMFLMNMANPEGAGPAS